MAETEVHIHIDFEAVQELHGPWQRGKNIKSDAKVLNESGQVTN